MNGLIFLSHWCENHGPSIVFCTQAFHLSNNSSNSTLPVSPQPSSVHSSNSTTASISEPQKNTFSERASPSLSPYPKQVSVAPLPPTSPGNVCSGCRPDLPFMEAKSPAEKETGPFGSRKGTGTEYKSLITFDDIDPNIYYYGSRVPRDAHIYGPVKNACIRSLHSEFCPGRDGPILFGDDQNGYVLSYMFRIKDLQARGESRFYSLMMLMTDRVYLVDCWGYLVNKFRSMATALQHRARIVYDSERIARERSLASRRLSSDQFLRHRANSPRSLADLLGIKDLFVQMHAQFSWTLRAAGRRKMEVMWKGKPREMVTENTEEEKPKILPVAI